MSNYTPSEFHDAVADAIAKRGWVDDGTAVPAIVKAARLGKADAGELARCAPATFLGLNGASRTELEGVLAAVVGGGFALVDKPAGPANITVSGGTNITIAVGSIIGRVENAAQGITSQDAREALLSVARAVEHDSALSEEQRLELLERVEFLSEQANAEPECRSKFAVQDVLTGLARAVEVSAAIATVWQVAGPAITKFFGF